MKNYFLVLPIILITLSCGHKSQTTNQADTVISKKQKTTKTDNAAIIADTTKKIIGYTVEHPFSDNKLNDIFSINLYGDKVLGGVVVFEIFDHTNKSIFKEKFSAEDLLGDQGDVLNEKQKLDTISMRMKTFLDKDGFHTPAIDAEESFDMAYSNTDSVNKAEWEEMKKDRSAIGFFYNYGYEGTYGIAYNKNKHHVFLIYYSD